MMGRFCRYAEKVFQLGQLIPQVRDDRQEPQIPTGAIWTSTFAMLAMGAGSLHAMESQLRVPKRLDGLVGPRKPSADTIGRVYAGMDADTQREIVRKIHLRSRRNKAQQNTWPLRFLGVDGHEFFSQSMPLL